jgi:hypothetical protein
MASFSTSRQLAGVAVMCLVVVGLHPTTYRTMLGQDADWDVKHWTPGPTLYLFQWRFISQGTAAQRLLMLDANDFCS